MDDAQKHGQNRGTPCEVSWFAALCDDDYEFLGVPDPRLASGFAHCRDIVLAAESGGLDGVLLPSGYALGIDTLAFASAGASSAHRHEIPGVVCKTVQPRTVRS